MDKLRNMRGALAARVGRLMLWLQATLARGPARQRDQESGQGLAEYALILAFIAIAVIGALGFFGDQLQAVFLDPINADISEVVDGL